jgi:hypothetical protein
MNEIIKQIRFLKEIQSQYNIRNFKKGEIITLPFLIENKSLKQKLKIENELRQFSDESNYFLSFAENEGNGGCGYGLKLNIDFEIIQNDIFILN